MTLQTLHEELRNCQQCGLAGSRTQVVFGEGNPKAEILFVGEAPGEKEDLQGRPFVGMAGKILNEGLERIGLRREDVYIANVVKCRPPENRNPQAAEIGSCIPFLWQQIELIRPRVVCTLGNFAAQTLLGQKTGIMKLRGRHYPVRDFFVFPMLHPAAVLHQGNLRRALEEDFQNLQNFLGQKVQPEPRTGQLGFF